MLAPTRHVDSRRVQANFFFGGGKIDDSKQYICIDCGYGMPL